MKGKCSISYSLIISLRSANAFLVNLIIRHPDTIADPETQRTCEKIADVMGYNLERPLQRYSDDDQEGGYSGIIRDPQFGLDPTVFPIPINAALCGASGSECVDMSDYQRPASANHLPTHQASQTDISTSSLWTPPKVLEKDVGPSVKVSGALNE
jgi:hypothetical protein